MPINIQKVDDPLERIQATRVVLYKDDRTSDDYVNTYDNIWAEKYNHDIENFGFKSWEYAVDRITKHMPNREALILDYCGGTGQVGKRLYAAGYRRLEIVDGSEAMLKQALALNVYQRMCMNVVPRGGRSRFLEENAGRQYDVVLSSMSVAEFKPMVNQVLMENLAPGGIFISLESEPHIADAGLDGIPWGIALAKDPKSNFELVEDSTSLPHDQFTDHKMKVVVIRKKK